MRRTLWLFLFCLAVVRLHAVEFGESFTKGNTLYAAEKFSEAAAAYETAIANGGRTANLFYNLGNAYFRAGDLGRAVLNFQRALELDPGHREAEANLALTRERIGVAISKPSGFLAKYFDWPHRLIAGVFTAGVWSVFIAVGLLVLRGRRGIGIALLCAGLLAAGFGLVAWIERGWDPADPASAVVAGEGAMLRYAPAESAPPSGNAPAGSHARILSMSGDWIYCEVDGRTRGWLQAPDVERFLPRQ